MKKTIYTLLCLCVFGFAEAQTNNIQTVNAFIEKVNTKLSTIKAAEYTLLHNPKVDKSELSTYKRTGYFEKLPLDTLVGCRFLVKTQYYSILYDGANRYNMDTDTLRIVNELQFSKTLTSKEEPQAPMVFNDLLNQFLSEYGATAEMINDNFKNNSMKMKVGQQKTKDIVYHTINCNRIAQKNPLVKTDITLYTTDDYLPVKLIVSRKIENVKITDEFFIEKYNLVESISDLNFLPEVLGKPVKTYHVTNPDNNYFEEVEK